MARTSVRRWGAITLAMAMTAGILAAGRGAGSAGEPVGERAPDHVRRVIRPGETLWELARSRVGPSEDPRPMIDALRRLNGLGTDSLQPGSTILIPAAP